MTPEEKAKAYDEALERAKSFQQKFGGDYAGYIFPELRESEDERIMNCIRCLTSLDQAQDVIADMGFTRQDLLAYLEKHKGLDKMIVVSPEVWDNAIADAYENGKKDGEKQKEQKPVEPIEFSNEFENQVSHLLASVLNGEHEYNEGFVKYVAQSLLGYAKEEQKPNLVPKIIRPKFAVGDTVCRNMWSDHTIQEIYIDCDDPVYICINEEGIESHISFSEQDEWERKEQKPVDWSDSFEENIRKLLHDKLTWHSEDGNMSSTVFIDDKTLKDIISGIWFYVGKEALKYPNNEIRVQEWSEEDETRLTNILIMLKEYAIHHYSKDDVNKSVDWLENRFKSLRPSWKPSEE